MCGVQGVDASITQCIAMTFAVSAHAVLPVCTDAYPSIDTSNMDPLSLSLFLLPTHSVTRLDTCLPPFLHAVPASALSTAQVFDIHDLSAWSYSEMRERERGKNRRHDWGNEEKEIKGEQGRGARRVER